MTDAARPYDADDDDPLARVSALVRDVPDFPEPGVVFRDITPVLADGAAFTAVAVALAALAGAADVVVGVEARGFLLGAAAALTAGTGIVPVRKAGKLPRVAASRSYDAGVRHRDAGAARRRGGGRGRGCSSSTTCWPPAGTAAAACDLVIAAGAEVVGFAAMIELVALGGRARLGAIPVHALLAY